MPASTASRRALLAVAVVSLAILGGCLGQSGGQPSETAERSDCPDDRITPVPYPDPPAELTNESVRAFVADLERAYVYTHETGENVTRLAFDPEPDAVTRLADGWSVRVETGLSRYSCADGTFAVGDGYYTARYFLNESVVYRIREGGAGPVADPREHGTRLRVGNATGDR
ncbi:hypothetical protein [Halorussus sp. AFM4]|uniref:hypothetical protein n=1 Tax=Halorussus sp. AFM4 TaxID=3421651 RepID=UPI003EB83C8C